MQAISAIGIFSSVIFAILLFNKKSKSYSDSILFVWMLFFIIHLTIPFMMAIGNRFFIEKVNGLDIGFYTLHLTFMYYYSLSITNNISRFKISHLEYLIPTAIVYVVQGVVDRNISIFSDIIQQHFFNENDIFHLTGVVILNLIFCIYFCRKSFGVLLKHRNTIKNNFSFSEKIDLLWLKNLFIATVIFTLIAVIYLVTLLTGHLSHAGIDNYYFTSFSVFAVVLGYWGYKQGIIANSILTVEKNNQGSLIENSKQVVSKKNDDIDSEKDENVQQLLDFMVKEKPHLNPSLNIGDLANKLGVHSHQLSKCINTHFNKNFFEFVNEYRVEEYKKLVANPKNKNFSILGLALDAGFNSKASFNRIFKNSTGLTPSEFRNQFKF